MTSLSFDTLSKPASASADLGESDIHVWKARLDVPRDRLRQLERTLAPGRARADHPGCVTKCRSVGALRPAGVSCEASSRDTPRDPRLNSASAYGPEGKPEMSKPRPAVSRSISTRRTRATLLLVAVGRVPSLGIDVERIRPIVRFGSALPGARSRRKRDARIEALRSGERNEAFITCWTRKEACVKAVGEGVWSAFGRFEVSVDARESQANC